MKGTATVFAAVYAAVVSRQVVEHKDGETRVVSVAWEKRRERAMTEARIAVAQYVSEYGNS